MMLLDKDYYLRKLVNFRKISELGKDIALAPRLYCSYGIFVIPIINCAKGHTNLSGSVHFCLIFIAFTYVFFFDSV